MVIPLHSIYFERGNSRVLKKSYPYLEDLVYYLQDNPELKIELLGHTDSQGSHKSSRQLSEERVGRIQHFLKNNNIHPHRIKAKGYGEMRPVAPNDSEENRAKNRRVEIRILDL
jgi:outer membrane protein OmpA-like peptidoglycan-associated protein